MENITTVSNDELLEKYPAMHQQASETLCTEENYPAVESWQVETDSQGNVQGVYAPIFADWYHA
jgi:asparagine synthetase A